MDENAEGGAGKGFTCDPAVLEEIPEAGAGDDVNTPSQTAEAAGLVNGSGFEDADASEEKMRGATANEAAGSGGYERRGSRQRARAAAGECSHSLRMGDLCAICGEALKAAEVLAPVLHTTDAVQQTGAEAYRRQLARNARLDRRKKLILLLDLDQTVLHTTTGSGDGDASFTIDGMDFHVKYRPGLRGFLARARRLFEIHVYTLGARQYAEEICRQIDPRGRIFRGRVVTRCENFAELTKSIARITPISSNVVVLDDRLDVWGYVPNLIAVRPFWHYSCGDINDPRELRRERGEAVASADASAIDTAPRPVRSEDRELSLLLRLLKRVHRRYFRQKPHVATAEILRLRIFEGRTFRASEQFTALLLFAGALQAPGCVQPDFVVEDARKAEYFQTLNVSSQWVLECIYARRLVDLAPYIIDDYRRTALADDYENELLNEFFDK